MLRPAVSILCTLAVLAPTAAFAGDRYDRRDSNHVRTLERVQRVDLYNRNRAFDRRDDRNWERRDARRDWERERYWRDRRDERRDDRRDDWRDRDRNRSRIIIFPRFSF